MSNRLSTKFCQTFEPNLEEAKRNNLIGKWLEHVQCSFLKVTYKEKVFFLDRGQVEAFASFEKCKNTPLAFTEELKTLTENNINIQSGDHIFMRLVKKDGPLDFILMFEPSGDHILETVDSEKTVCQVPFLLDYTRRWSSRVENFSGAVRDEIPLIFLSFQFFCSTPMLVGTIALLVYIITCKTIAVLYFGAYSADAYNIAGLLAVVVLVSCLYLIVDCL